LHRYERSPHRNLGLTKPHISTYQPIHGSAILHIVQNGFDSVLLVGSFFEGKAGGKLVVVIAAELVFVTFLGFALCIDVE